MRAKEQLWDVLRRAQGIVRLERRLDRMDAALDARIGALEAQLEAVGSQLEGVEWQLRGVAATTTDTERFLTGETHRVLRAIATQDAENRRRLWSARVGDTYERPFVETEPLVSVVVPTFNRPDLLRERSLPSILGQSYERLEVIVVGDHAVSEVEQAARSIEDPRISFHNLTQRLPPRPDPEKQWYIHSVMARNEGMRLARGSWLMTFDDDDRMCESAVARLLEAARATRAEVAYGRFRSITPTGTLELGAFPPELGQFTWQTGICHSALRFFERELVAADFDQPNDFFLVDAMLRAGVRFAMIHDLVCDLYPSSGGKTSTS